MLRLDDAWLWDFWLADDGARHHLFFLSAPQTPDDPERRHWQVRIGHAVSTDLREWTLLPDALAPSETPAFDDRSTWTGSIVRGPDGTWFMYYTGAGTRERGLKQRIGLATSTDLTTWSRRPGPILESDPRWYEQLGSASWPDEAWRDPWVLADPGGDGWHMLLTARASSGPVDERGVIGHARSHDLVHWEARPPLTRPGAGFGHLEVPQVEVVDGRAVLLFSSLRRELSQARRARNGHGGVWIAEGASELGPFDVAGARTLTDESLYSGRLVQDRQGAWWLLAFRHAGPDGGFVGELADPIPFSLP
jgi:beta-fructofuranosidase